MGPRKKKNLIWTYKMRINVNQSNKTKKTVIAYNGWLYSQGPTASHRAVTHSVMHTRWHTTWSQLSMVMTVTLSLWQHQMSRLLECGSASQTFDASHDESHVSVSIVHTLLMLLNWLFFLFEDVNQNLLNMTTRYLKISNNNLVHRKIL